MFRFQSLSSMMSRSLLKRQTSVLPGAFALRAMRPLVTQAVSTAPTTAMDVPIAYPYPKRRVSGYEVKSKMTEARLRQRLRALPYPTVKRPKMAPNGFMVFVRQNSAAVRKNIGDNASPKAVMLELKRQWDRLADGERKEYITRSEAFRSLNSHRMVNYGGSRTGRDISLDAKRRRLRKELCFKTNSKFKTIKNIKEPKRPYGAFGRFLKDLAEKNEKLVAVMGEHTVETIRAVRHFAPRDFVQAASEFWRTLNQDAKQGYLAQANEELQKYLIDYKAYSDSIGLPQAKAEIDMILNALPEVKITKKAIKAQILKRRSAQTLENLKIRMERDLAAMNKFLHYERMMAERANSAKAAETAEEPVSTISPASALSKKMKPEDVLQADVMSELEELAYQMEEQEKLRDSQRPDQDEVKAGDLQPDLKHKSKRGDQEGESNDGSLVI